MALFETHVGFFCPPKPPFDALAIICKKKTSEAKAVFKFTFNSVTVDTSYIAADLAGKQLGAVGAIMFAAFLPKCV